MRAHIVSKFTTSVVVAGSIGLGATAYAPTAYAQPAQTVVPLPAPDAVLDEDFSRLLSVRELSSGRVLLTDDKDSRIYSADFQTRKVRTLGGTGDGPNEYRAVGRLWDIGNDSTFMSVPYRSRWLILHRDSIVRTYTGQLPVILAVGRDIIRGADARGNILTIAAPKRIEGKPFVMPDSLVYVRTNRSTMKVDTVVKTINSDKDIMSEGGPRARGAAAAPSKPVYNVSLKARDQLTMFSDGAVAVLSGNPLRVDWCVTAGKPCTRGTPIANTVRAWTDADKTAYLKAMNALGAWPPTENVEQTTGWPENLPAFATPGGPDDANFWPTPSGKVVIERIPNSQTTLVAYDVVDRSSKLVARVSVPPGHRILGFGAKSVYVIRVDSDDVQHVQRHPWRY